MGGGTEYDLLTLPGALRSSIDRWTSAGRFDDRWRLTSTSVNWSFQCAATGEIGNGRITANVVRNNDNASGLVNRGCQL